MNEQTEAAIVEMLGVMQRDLGELKGQTSQILVQAKRTNGAVLDHERRLHELETASAKASGAKSVRHSIAEKAWSVCEKLAILLCGIFAGRWFN
ncbi:MAG: hypothetical protein ACM3ZC_13555 [Bacteroidota bacterium]